MIATSPLICEFATEIRENSRRLFCGPTMIRIGRPTEKQGIFKEISYAVRRGAPGYSTYIESKSYAKQVYVENYTGEKYVDAMSVVEPHDKNAVIVYSRDKKGNIDSTLRMCLDAGSGLPLSEDLAGVVCGFRRQGLTVAEPSRFTSGRGARMGRHLVSAAFEIALLCGIDIYLIQCKSDYCDFYRSNLAAEILENYPAPYGCKNMVWRVSATPKETALSTSSNRVSLKKLINCRRSMQ